MTTPERKMLYREVRVAARKWAKANECTDFSIALQETGAHERGLSADELASILHQLDQSLTGDHVPGSLALNAGGALPGVELVPVEFFDPSGLTGRGKTLQQYVNDRRDWVYPPGEWTASNPVPSTYSDQIGRIQWDTSVTRLGAFQEIASKAVWQVAWNLATYANARTGGPIFPADETVADETGLSRVTVNRARQGLRAHGWLKVIGHRKVKGRSKPIDHLAVPRLIAPALALAA